MIRMIIKTTLSGQCATLLFGLTVCGSVAAECERVDYTASVCRYPAGDAWCARHGDGALYAYQDGCVEDTNIAETETNRAPRPSPPATSWSPMVAWDCAKAKTRVEHLICANPEVRAQDARMGALYADLRARGRLPERTQKAWLLGQRNACETLDCLRTVYAERIRALETLATAVPVADVPPMADAQAIEVPDADPETAHPRPPSFATVEAPAEIPAPTPTTQSPDAPSPDGIPMLPRPETSTTATERDPVSQALMGASAGTPPHSSIPSGGLVLMGAVLLVMGFGLFAWRGGWRIGAAARRALAVLAKRQRIAVGVWFGGWRRTRRSTPAAPEPPAGTFDAVPALAPVAVLLPDDTLARLCALARPGEPLPSVVARAVAALEAVADPLPTASITKTA